MHGIGEHDRPFYTGTEAWHGLGEVLDAPPSFQWFIDRLPEAGEEALWTADGLMAPNHKAIILKDPTRVGGIVGKDYCYVPYEQQFEVLRSLEETWGYTLEAGGTLFDGSRAFLVLATPESLDPGDGSTVQPYIVALTSIDGTLTFNAGPSAIRVECNNMAQMWLRQSDNVRFRLKHTKGFEARLEWAAQVVEQMGTVSQQSVEQWQKLVGHYINDDTAVDFFNEVHPLSEKSAQVKTARGKHEAKIDRLFAAYYRAPGAQPGSLWGAVQAVTYDATNNIKDGSNIISGRFAAQGGTRHIVNRAYDLAYNIAA